MPDTANTRWPWIPALVFATGFLALASYFVILETYIQYHWDVRMDHIQLFFGAISPSEMAIGFVFLVQLSLAIGVVVVYVMGRHTLSSRIIALSILVLGGIIVLQPFASTALLVGPAILLDMGLAAFQMAPGFLLPLGSFILVLAVHVVVVWLVYRFADYRAKRAD